MKRDIMVIVDNSKYSINKDYNTKERLQCQIEAIKGITEKRLSESVESTIGVMSLGRSAIIKVISPTNDRNTVYTFLHTLQRDDDIQGGNSIAIAKMALKYRTNPMQQILLFLGSPLEDTNLMEIVESTEDAISNGISVGIVLFGEAIEYYILLKESIEETPDFTCITVRPQDSFIEAVSVALRESVQEVDPELEMAIQRSLQDTEDPEVQRAIRESMRTG